MRPWATRTAKTALLAAGFAAAGGGLSGVALAAGSNVSSDASPGLSLGPLVAPAVVRDDAGALLGVVGAACQVCTAGLSPPPPPAGHHELFAWPAARAVRLRHARRARRLHRGLRERRAGRCHAAAGPPPRTRPAVVPLAVVPLAAAPLAGPLLAGPRA